MVYVSVLVFPSAPFLHFLENVIDRTWKINKQSFNNMGVGSDKRARKLVHMKNLSMF